MITNQLFMGYMKKYVIGGDLEITKSSRNNLEISFREN